MDKKLRNKIISEYKNGKSSTKIEKELRVSKPTILKILNEEGLIRKRDRCSTLDIKKEGDNFYVIRNCPMCKEEIKTFSKDKIIACRNHFNKINNNSLCKPCSLKLQVGEGNPFYGKKHTEETKKEMSKVRKGKGTGEKNSMSNPLWRLKSSQNLKKRWESGELENTRKKMSEQLKKTRREGKLKSHNTSKKEKEILLELKKLGLNATQSYKIDTKICDIYIPEFNLVIEYFGDYWHCNPNKYESTYVNKKKGMLAKEIWEYDKRKIDLIVSFGYNLEVIWESELKLNNKKILEILKKYDKKSRNAPEWS